MAQPPNLNQATIDIERVGDEEGDVPVDVEIGGQALLTLSL
jgi:hypothetical protein